MSDRTPRVRPLSLAAQRSLRFLVALGLLVYEAVLRDGPPRIELMLAYLGMMGLPVANRADDLRRMALGRRGQTDE